MRCECSELTRSTPVGLRRKYRKYMVSREVLDPPPTHICIIDSSFLIRIKSMVKVDEQWALLAWMMERTEAGEICFPRQVSAEMTVAKHPDAPGAWAGHAKGLVRHREPSDASVAQ